MKRQPLQSVRNERYMSERKLASIRRIINLSPIDGADNIELAVVDGWECIVKKGQFKIDDLCIYFEIGSFLPVIPEFEFLRKSSYKKMLDKEGFHIKTFKLRRVISQGLALPMPLLGFLPEGLKEGDDITGAIGVVKYERPCKPFLGQPKNPKEPNFPSFLIKTDQERIQNAWGYIVRTRLQDIWDNVPGCTKDEYEVTLKLHGTSCTYYLYEDKFGVCSRNFELDYDENHTFWKIAKELDIENTLRSIVKRLSYEGIALQGEVVGEGINSNFDNIKGHSFYLFDILKISNGNACKLLPSDRMKCVPHLNGIKHVPVLDSNCNLAKFGSSCDTNKFQALKDLISYADGPSINSPIREGVVFKSLKSNFSFKVISNEYLLSGKD